MPAIVADDPSLPLPTMFSMSRWPKVLLMAVLAAALLLGGATLLLNRLFPPERLAALLSA
jgi:hypothetical protein